MYPMLLVLAPYAPHLLIAFVLLVLGAVVGRLAERKGRNAVGWWIYGAFLFPVALVHVLMLPASDPETALP